MADCRCGRWQHSPLILEEFRFLCRRRYLGLHNDLDALLEVRALAINGNKSTKAVSVVYYSASHSPLMQNWVYTAVK